MKYSFDIEIEVTASSDPYDGFVEAESEEEAEAMVRELLAEEHMVEFCDDVGIVFDDPDIRVTVHEEE